MLKKLTKELRQGLLIVRKVVNMISLGVNSAYAPWFFDQVKNNANSKKNIVSVTEKIVILYTVVAVCVSWIAPELLQLISKPAYHESWTVTPLIAMAFVINGFYFTFSSVFFLEKIIITRTSLLLHL